MNAPGAPAWRCWLVAGLFALVPIAFNPFTHNRYELQKAALVGAVVGLGLVAGMLGTRGRRRSWLRSPLLWPVAAVGATYVLATLCSVDRAVSVLGLSERGQGLWVIACFLVVYAWLAREVAAPRRGRWLLAAAALGSLPVCALGIYEHLVVNPVVGRPTFSRRAASTLGNPMLLGDYLVMVIPATVALGWAGRGARRWGWWAAAALQVVCLVFTKTRTAWAALLVVACVGLVAAGWAARRRWLTVAGLGLPAAAVALVVAINAPWSVGRRVREWPFLERLAIVSELRAGGGVERVRPTVWRACLRLIAGRTSQPVGPAALRPARPWVGYGPETLSSTFWTVFPARLVADEGRRTQVDRAHCLLIDVAIERGLLGVAATVWLWLAFVKACIAGLRRGGEGRGVIAACLAGAGAHLLAAQMGLELTTSGLLAFGYFGIVSGLARAREPLGEVSGPRPGQLAARVGGGLVGLVVVLVAAVLVAADAQVGRAFRLRRRGQMMPALRAASHGVRLMPLASDYHMLLSQLSLDVATRGVPQVKGSEDLRRELFEQSLAKARDAISLRPLMAPYYEAAAKVCAAAGAAGFAGLGDQAMHYWQAGVAICSGRPQFWEGMAREHLARGAADKAIACLRQSLRIEPRRPQTWCALARAAMAKGDRAEAKASVDEALRLDPGHPEATRLREQILAGSG